MCVVGQWLLQGLFQMLPHLTCACRHWHCSCGKCSAGSTVRGAEHDIYLDGNSFASSLAIPEALSGLPTENVVSCSYVSVA